MYSLDIIVIIIGLLFFQNIQLHVSASLIQFHNTVFLKTVNSCNSSIYCCLCVCRWFELLDSKCSMECLPPLLDPRGWILTSVHSLSRCVNLVMSVHLVTLFTCRMLLPLYHVRCSHCSTHAPPQALYVYQPSLIDAQLLQAWLTVLQSAYVKLYNLTPDLFVAHLPRLFVICVRCLLSNKDTVKAAAASVMEVNVIIRINTRY